MKYIPAATPAVPGEIRSDSYIFIFNDRRITLIDDRIPQIGEIASAAQIKSGWLYFGMLGGRQCFCTEGAIAGNSVSRDLREYLGRQEPETAAVISRAAQLARWHMDSKFCGCCGAANISSPGDFAKLCPQCGRLDFPRLCPAVIVAVTRQNKILLAHNKNFRPGLYSTVAGFVEAGESLEQCVEREIREEVGIEVRNIRYFSSQSWPFPHSLMIGFTAEYASGELTPDGDEIIDAGWFAPDELPELPSPSSISRRLIDNFLSVAPALIRAR